MISITRNSCCVQKFKIFPISLSLSTKSLTLYRHHAVITCHHNLIFAKVSANVSLPPNYSREVWDYKNANVEGIQKSISLFNQEKAFENLSTKEKVGLLNNTLLNIFRNYIPNKIVKCSYRDPAWITKQTSKN